jgi:hypothetical protein
MEEHKKGFTINETLDQPPWLPAPRREAFDRRRPAEVAASLLGA